MVLAGLDMADEAMPKSLMGSSDGWWWWWCCETARAFARSSDSIHSLASPWEPLGSSKA